MKIFIFSTEFPCHVGIDISIVDGIIIIIGLIIRYVTLNVIAGITNSVLLTL